MLLPHATRVRSILEQSSVDPIQICTNICSGMKQSGHVWNETLHLQMMTWGFQRLECEYCIYFQHTGNDIIIVAIHVNDFFMVSSSRNTLARFRMQLQSVWQISDTGDTHFCVGIALSRDRARRTVSLSQTALIDCIISQFGLSDAHHVSIPMDPGLCLSCLTSNATSKEQHRLTRMPYRSLVGSLMYLALGTRPDIAYAVQQLCRYLDCYRAIHWEATKRVVRYLKGTRTLALTLGGEHTARLLGHTDTDFATCTDTCRSVSGYCFSLGLSVVTWSAHQ